MKQKILGFFLLGAALAIVLFVLYFNSERRSVPLVFSSAEMLSALWNDHVNRYLEKGTGRTVDEERGGITTSEGQAYTMLRAVWMGDKKIFDDSAAWTESNLKHRGDNLYSWLYGKKASGKFGVLTERGGNNSASDADTDIALAYALAYKRWGNQKYLDRSLLILNDVWKKEVLVIKGEPVLVTNDVEKTTEKEYLLVNPSYFSPYAYRVFAKIDKNHPWEKLVLSSYRIIEDSMTLALGDKNGAGLPSDWLRISRITGELISAPEPDKQSSYGFDAMRVPWKVALDYDWSHDVRPKKLLEKLSFLGREWENVKQLAAVYAHDGEVELPIEAPAFYGTSIGYFLNEKPEAAKEIYQKKLLSLYNPNTDAWKFPLSYYDENWAWFGIALYNSALNDYF